MDSELYLRGIKLFNSGAYFEAHEVLEDVWRAAPVPEKKFLQGLIQVAVGLHHHSKGNVVGARSLLARAVQELVGLSGRLWRNPVAGIAALARAVAARAGGKQIRPAGAAVRRQFLVNPSLVGEIRARHPGAELMSLAESAQHDEDRDIQNRAVSFHEEALPTNPCRRFPFELRAAVNPQGKPSRITRPQILAPTVSRTEALTR